MKKISRRDTLFYITLATVAAGLPAGCKTDNKEMPKEGHEGMHDNSDGFKGLSEEDKLLLQEKFFTDHERETVRVLANRIIPADEKSGNAEEAGCVQFIEFMMLDFPEEYEVQTKMRGGLAWLNAECMKRFSRFRHLHRNPANPAPGRNRLPRYGKARNEPRRRVFQPVPRFHGLRFLEQQNGH